MRGLPCSEQLCRDTLGCTATYKQLLLSPRAAGTAQGSRHGTPFPRDAAKTCRAAPSQDHPPAAARTAASSKPSPVGLQEAEISVPRTSKSSWGSGPYLPAGPCWVYRPGFEKGFWSCLGTRFCRVSPWDTQQGGGAGRHSWSQHPLARLFIQRVPGLTLPNSLSQRDRGKGAQPPHGLHLPLLWHTASESPAPLLPWLSSQKNKFKNYPEISIPAKITHLEWPGTAR